MSGSKKQLQKNFDRTQSSLGELKAQINQLQKTCLMLTAANIALMKKGIVTSAEITTAIEEARKLRSEKFGVRSEAAGTNEGDSGNREHGVQSGSGADSTRTGEAVAERSGNAETASGTGLPTSTP